MPLTDNTAIDPAAVALDVEMVRPPVAPSLWAGFLMPLGFLAVQAGFVALALSVMDLTFLSGRRALSTISILAGAGLIMLLVSRLLTVRHGPAYADALGWRRSVLPVGKTVWTLILLFIGIRVGVGLYYGLFLDENVETGGAEQMLAGILASGRAIDAAVALLYMVLLGPLVEELIFRGYLQSALSARFGAVAGILVAALAFALFHGSLVLLPLYLLMGIGFGLALHVTRSLWAAIALHLTNNLLAFVAEWAGWT